MLSANFSQPKRPQRHREVDARIGNALIEVKFGVDSLRTIRTSLMQVAYPLSENPVCEGFVVLVDSPITMERLRDEWERAATVLRDDVLHRLTICLQAEGRMTGIPRDPDVETQRILAKVVEDERGKMTTTRTDYSFVVLKLLLHRWLTSGEPVTSEWLARTAGCSYPAVARALRPLGSLLERRSDRRVRLRWFPKDEFARLLAVADRARSTVRFTDQSGQPRSAESHLRRLEKLNPPSLAIGGVLGAKHYYPDLDLVGTPRLDLSMHCPGRRRNKDLGRVLAIAALTLDDAIENEWPQRLAAALTKCFPHRWRELVATVGDGMRTLLASGEDLQEATFLCANGLLSHRNATAAQLKDIGQRLITFAIETLEQMGRSA